jgi:hypothetical protein
MHFHPDAVEQGLEGGWTRPSTRVRAVQEEVVQRRRLGAPGLWWRLDPAFLGQGAAPMVIGQAPCGLLAAKSASMLAGARAGVVGL